MRCYVDMLLITSTANIKTWERDNGLYGGLSPLARGTRLLAMAYMAIGWFIPAGAGNTHSITTDRQSPAVYPRWRGEHSMPPSSVIPWSGLSPLARGTLHRHPADVRRRRFIPAGAGNTIRGARSHTLQTVYPRWRGEHDIWLDARGVYIGLSPLARGTQRISAQDQLTARFIPAGAGNTKTEVPVLPESPVYPRWRGEHDYIYQNIGPVFGLSPLARGTL